MATKSGALDYWRNYFRTANSDIFTVIEFAIMVAASDRPHDFMIKRDRIAERLFSCRLTRCFGCDHVELAIPEMEGDESFKSGGGKESKVNSSLNDNDEMNANRVINYSYEVAEALTEEMEEESQIIGEVLRIKIILNNGHDEVCVLLSPPPPSLLYQSGWILVSVIATSIMGFLLRRFGGEYLDSLNFNYCSLDENLCFNLLEI